ncbi:trans-2,3-enoyl-CoA reductase-like isoform X1 [Hypomesus transpacificus]|uniref:trans-2,3-enoyl-CoA reductase-like isoform X1 n=1 Tax=Hypomesus transpacificus TaxID=137520 RepID=UPI001F07D42B|nr:trans-2,3-enoyl-CoA reductase-like isoform X1 [Hypomesus transpacificus]
MPPMQQNAAANFHGNFQAVGNRVDLQGTLFRLGNKSGYIEVEILNPQTGRTMCVIDKVHPSSTVLDLKNRFHKACPARHPCRTGLRMSVNGPFLRDQCDLRSVATSPLLSVYSEDLGRQVGWNTVFLAQYVGPLLIYLVFYLRLSSVYDDATQRRRHQVVDLACFCHSLHYVKHLLETLFVHSDSDGCTPLGGLLKVCAFYWGFTCWLGYYINHPLYTPPYYSGKQVIPSLVCFLICECGNLCINISLARHKQTRNELTHPTSTSNPFTWLFTLVHCPQYTYEIGAWLALSIMTQTVPVAVFAGLLTVQMLLWARRRQGRYLRRVKNARRFWRKAVIPFLF